MRVVRAQGKDTGTRGIVPVAAAKQGRRHVGGTSLESGRIGAEHPVAAVSGIGDGDGRRPGTGVALNPVSNPFPYIAYHICYAPL